jgi:pimeloyl-ACP methyl ester carboxylesterase
LARRVCKYPEKRLPDDRPEHVVHGNTGKVAHYHGGVPHDVEMIKRLKDITAPALILYGDEEEMTPIETVRVLSDNVPRHFLIYVADAKHSIQVDQPERMTRLVRDFFNRGEAFIVRQQAAE